MKALKALFYTLIFLILIYIISGFTLIPYILKKELIKNLDENLTLKSSIRDISFNPITLDTKIYDFKLIDNQEKDIVSFKQLNIELSILKSIEQKHFRIENITLDEFFINIIQEKDGSINLANIVKPSQEEESKTEAIEPKEDNSSSDIKFLISKIDLKNADIIFTSNIQKESFSLSLKDINYVIYDLGTFKNSLSSNSLKFKINEHTDVEISSAFNINPFKAYGKVSIYDLRIKEIIDFDKNFFNFELNDNANINIGLNYNIDATNDLALYLYTDLLEANNIDLKQNQKSVASLKKLNIKEFNFDLISQNINFNDILIDDLKANMILDKDGVNFANLVKTSNSEEKDEETSNSKPWILNFSNIKANANYNFDNKENSSLIDVKNISLDAKNLKIIDSLVELEKANIVSQNFSYIDNLNNLEVNSNDINIDLNQLKVNDNISFLNATVISKDLNFDEKSSKISVDSKNINLALDNFLLDANSTISLNSIKLIKPTVVFKDLTNNLEIKSNDISIDLNKLKIDDNVAFLNTTIKSPELNFKEKSSNINIDSKNINLALDNFLLDANNNLSLNSIKLSKPTVILEDLTNNLKIDAKDLDLTINKFTNKGIDISLASVNLKEPNLTFENRASNLKIDTKNIDLKVKNLSNKNNIFKIEKIDLNNPIVSIALQKTTTSNIQNSENIEDIKVVENNQQNSKSDEKTILDIGPININNATFNFEDKNLPIAFKTTVTKLNGKVSNINNTKASKTNLDVKGVIDDYGVAQITGVVNPNNIRFLTDINMKFQNIAMQNFTPYTAKFIGKELKSGKLDLDLNYNITKSNLNAKNNIVITKIELGEDVQSPDAISLPLGIAISLLEDKNNVIDINLPVSGNVDDPQFSIGAILWKAFVNLITKAVTAPFSLLGSLFNFSEDEISSVKFELKESEITPIQKETLDKIAKILEARKDVAIKIATTYDKEKESEDIGKERILNIKEYLTKEKSIDSEQVILDEKTQEVTSSTVNLKIEQANN